MKSTFKGAKSQVKEMSHVHTMQNRKWIKCYGSSEEITSDTRDLRKLLGDGPI